MGDPIHVELLGRSHAVTLPDFAAREELVVAYSEAHGKRGVAALRVYSAALGLCTRLGKESGADYAKHRFDVLSYGGEVYGWLRKQGLDPVDIGKAGAPIIVALSEALFPRQDEVETAAGNSEARGAK